MRLRACARARARGNRGVGGEQRTALGRNGRRRRVALGAASRGKQRGGGGERLERQRACGGGAARGAWPRQSLAVAGARRGAMGAVRRGRRRPRRRARAEELVGAVGSGDLQQRGGEGHREAWPRARRGRVVRRRSRGGGAPDVRAATGAAGAVDRREQGRQNAGELGRGHGRVRARRA